MWGNVGCHSYCYAGGAVEEKVWKLCRQHCGLFERSVVIWHKIHCVLFNICKHLLRDFREANLGVTHGCSRIAIDGPEVPLAIDQRIAHGECLSQAHYGLVDCKIPVGVVLTHDISHHTGRLLVGLIMGHALLIHGIEYAPVNGLEAVSHIRQGPSNDHTHGVIDVRGFHLLSDVNLYFRQKPPQLS